MTETLDETTEPIGAPESDDEAEEAEESPEETEGPQEGDGEATEAAGVVSDKEMEQALDRLAKEATRHANRVSEIMGEDAQVLVSCELCEPAIPGFHWPGAVDDEKRAAVLSAVGMAALEGLVHDPEAETCDLCNGRGELLTGSQVESQRTRPCGKCGANGWTSMEQRRTYDSTQAARVAAAGIVPAHPERALWADSTLPATDAWQRPAGHEFYGKNPVYMTAAERARDHPGVA